MSSNSKNLQIEHFAMDIDGNTINIHILNLNKSVVVWVNSSESSMKSLAVSMQTAYCKDPSTLNLIGDYSSEISCNLAQRLCERVNKQVFVSCNFPELNQTFLNKVEPFLVKELLG